MEWEMKTLFSINSEFWKILTKISLCGFLPRLPQFTFGQHPLCNKSWYVCYAIHLIARCIFMLKYGGSFGFTKKQVYIEKH